MAQFNYTARNSEGKLINGTLNANDRAAAIIQLEQDRCFPIKIEAVLGGSGGSPGRGVSSEKKSSPGSTPPLQTLGATHQHLFTEQLAHVLSSGMTLEESLKILGQRLKHPKLQALSTSLHQSLIDGRSLSQALGDFPRIFTPLYVNMVAAGEASGSLSGILHRLVNYLADIKNLRERVQQALVYPMVLVFAGIVLTVVFMTTMVPKITDFFATSGGKLPATTQMLLKANHLLMYYWWVGVLVVMGIVSLFKFYVRSPEGRLNWDRFRWKIPGYGTLLRYRFYAQFARTLGTLVENGLTMLRALELLENTSGSEYIRLRLIDVRKAVIDGASLSVALRHFQIFPELFLDMMAVGEQTGKFGETMQMIADVYERELDKQVKLISTLIPPIIMICIAAVIGTVVYAILSAVFSMTQNMNSRGPI